jgi:hypothetical protein
MTNSSISFLVPTLAVSMLAGCQSGPDATRQGQAPHADHANATRQLEQVKSMAGTWYLADAADGDAPTAIYRVVANETAVEERLFPGQAKEMITMYFIDEGRLTLTHFCALGNQPTMGAVEGDDDEINFGFIGITDLASPTSQHMHEHTLEFYDDPDRVDSTWILWNDGAEAERRRFPLERRMSTSN